MYHLWQCPNPACGFRFPAADDAPGKERCIYCGTATEQLQFPPRPLVPPRPSIPLPPVEVLLDNIRSLYNVGGIFRAADGAGVRHLHLCGITGTPAHPKLAKTALGAQDNVPWSHHLNGVAVGRALKEQGYQLWALESSPTAEPLFATRLPLGGPPLLLIVGNEVTGVDPDLLALCDKVVFIPMQGIKESLNVTTAFGAAVYHLLYVR
ncbi:MAG: RNA methyltransferase [Chloroflexi bacterium]|nr:RNA methyltransferase [Chloroflexota bacterium]